LQGSIWLCLALYITPCFAKVKFDFILSLLSLNSVIQTDCVATKPKTHQKHGWYDFMQPFYFD